MKQARVILLLTAVASLAMVCAVSGQSEEGNIALKTIRGPVYLVEHVDGGNIVVYIGKDNVLMVDTGADPADAPNIEAAIRRLTGNPVTTVINTHWHGDHVAGNIYWAEKGATIIAHTNVLRQLSRKTFMEFFGNTREPLPGTGRPTVVFEKKHIVPLDGDTVHVFHLCAGHTDGDGIVRFAGANVIHVGDLYFNGYYPYIGVSSGGSVSGMITALNQVLSTIDDETVIVPGHGPLSDKRELSEYVRMLTVCRDRVLSLIQAGASLEEIQAAGPTAEFDPAWGQEWMSGDEFVRLLVMDLGR